jgi:hypothetical protein
MREIRLFLLVFELSFWAVYSYQSGPPADARRVVPSVERRADAPRKPLPQPGVPRQPKGESARR